jgi:hypothetical protein
MVNIKLGETAIFYYPMSNKPAHLSTTKKSSYHNIECVFDPKYKTFKCVSLKNFALYFST